MEEEGSLFCGAESLAPLLSTSIWKIANEFVDLAKDVYKQSVEGAAWFILATYSEMWEERDKSREGMLKRRWDFMILKILRISRWQRC